MNYVFIANSYNFCTIYTFIKVPGGAYPWYVFRGHRVQYDTELPDSLVKYEFMPTPPILQEAFEKFEIVSNRGKLGIKARNVFVNAQWALGSKGSGAPVSKINRCYIVAYTLYF